MVPPDVYLILTGKLVIHEARAKRARDVLQLERAALCAVAVEMAVAPSFVVADLNMGVLFFLAMSSLAAYSVIIGGWASNSKFAFLGSLRAIAQLLSY